jgi:hypothetical protein
MSENDLKCEMTPATMSVSPSLPTNKTAVILCKKIPVLVIEMEDVCYHAGSGLLLPEDPAGTKEGESDSQAQKKVSGVAALALIFRHFEEAPYRHLLIVGHDDTEGSPQQGFDISKKRAEGVYYLLTGKKKEWCEHALTSHTIKDFQQIMLYYHLVKGWNCNPGEINDKWSPKTEKAVKVFFDEISKFGGTKKVDSSAVSSSPKKKWPIEAWEIIYDFYESLMFSALNGGKPVTGETLAKARGRLRFLDENKPIVACGDSFPTSHFGKKHFRSQADRRVEMLLFSDDIKLNYSLPCPKTTTSRHTVKQCPLHKLSHINRTYISPSDLNSALYHIKFEYYDKIRGEVCFVPNGLKINAFKAGHPPNYHWEDKNGVYAIRIYNIPGGKRENDVHFTFETKNVWVYTKDKNSQPKIVYTFADVDPSLPKTPITREELAKKPFSERIHYYDLPEQWDSRNWWCRIDQKSGFFSNLIVDITSISAPVVFFLDDMVLVDSAGSLEITDKDGEGSSKPLHADRSRIRFLVVDPASKQLGLFQAKEGDPLFQFAVKYDKDLTNPGDKITDPSKFLFQKNSSGTPYNGVRAPGRHVRAVLFCGEIYDVTNKRTQKNVDIKKGQVLGARAAVKDDKDVHHSESMQADTLNTFIHYPRIGNFDIHYLHEGTCDNQHDYSYAVIYWSAVINADTAPIIGGTPDQRAATPKEVADFKTIGMDNSMRAWNRKGYIFTDSTGLKSRLIIKPFFIFEAFESFNYVPPHAIDFTDDDYDVLFKRNDFKNALKSSYGGKPKVIAFITCEEKGSWVLSTHSPHRKYGLADLAIKDMKENPNYFTGYYPYTEFGELYKGVLAMGHEIGHATGQVDDYLEENCYAWNGTKWEKIKVPAFQQWGYDEHYDSIKSDKSNFPSRVTGSDPWENKYDPYSMMCFMGPIRMRYIWRFAHWINENGATLPGPLASGPLNKFTDGVAYKIKSPSAGMEYFRTAGVKNDPYSFFSHASIKVSDGTEVVLKTTNDKTVSVYLYRNLDETRLLRRITGNVSFKAILVVRVLMTIEFLPDAGGTGWSTAEKTNFAEMLRLPFADEDHAGIKGKYCIRGGREEYNPTFIHLLPGFEFSTNLKIIESSNYHIKVKKNSADPIGRVGKVLTVGDAISGLEMFNMFFNKTAGDAAFNLAPHNDFAFLEHWLATKCGIGCRVHEL